MAAQGPPLCGENCLAAGYASATALGCVIDDLTCVCAYSSFLNDFRSCVEQDTACISSASAAENVISYEESLCTFLLTSSLTGRGPTSSSSSLKELTITTSAISASEGPTSTATENAGPSSTLFSSRGASSSLLITSTTRPSSLVASIPTPSPPNLSANFNPATSNTALSSTSITSASSSVSKSAASRNTLILPPNTITAIGLGAFVGFVFLYSLR